MDHQRLDRGEGNEISINMKIADDESNPSEVTEVKDPSENVKEDNSRNKTNILGEKVETQIEKGDHVIDVKSETELKNGETSGAEKVCRICHLSTESSSGSSELIQLGCGCKAELGLSHLHCAESWFKQRGNRDCEICGKTAKNITGIEQVRPAGIDWNETRIAVATNSYPLPEESTRRCKQSLCNMLLACLVLAFVVPWFFRINLV